MGKTEMLKLADWTSASWRFVPLRRRESFQHGRNRPAGSVANFHAAARKVTHSLTQHPTWTPNASLGCEKAREISLNEVREVSYS